MLHHGCSSCDYLLDYVGAFTVLGLVGIFKKNKNQTPVLVIGAAVVCVLRYICHVITGCTVWAGVSIPTATEWHIH